MGSGYKVNVHSKRGDTRSNANPLILGNTPSVREGIGLVECAHNCCRIDVELLRISDKREVEQWLEVSLFSILFPHLILVMLEFVLLSMIRILQF